MYVSTNGGGSTMAFPNTCLTPAAPSPVPVPYPSIGQCSAAKSGTFAEKVKILNKNVLTEATEISQTSGDEAGTNGGVTSGTHGGPCARAQASSKVNVEGTPLVRQLDMIESNGASPNAPVGSQLDPSQTVVICMS